MRTQMATNSAEILMVGGGPAGLSAAIALRQRGADVLVVEAQRPPIDKACGEGLMPDSRVELERLGITLTPQDGGEFRGIRFANSNSRQECVSARFANGVGLGVRRVSLHQLMIERAQSLGVRMAWNTRGVVRAEESPGCGIAIRIPVPGGSRWPGLQRAAMGEAGAGHRDWWKPAIWFTATSRSALE